MIDEAIAERTQLFRHGRYIETGFPFERLSLIVRREKHAMKPLYQMHSWFARRAGSVFRAILTGLILDAHSNEDDFWQLFYSSAKPLGLICADPMMGGGSTIVEALHMGCKGVIGVDLNPIAWFVTKKELERVDLGRLEEEFKSLEKRVKPKISQFYATSCPTCRTQSDLVHVYWVKEIVCERCRKPLPLYQYYALARMGKKAWIYCPHCDECFSVSSQNDVLRYPKCPKCRAAPEAH